MMGMEIFSRLKCPVYPSGLGILKIETKNLNSRALKLDALGLPPGRGK
jgi:hypothetical protein